MWRGRWACRSTSLVLATNENDVLDEFFHTGTYRVRGSAETVETSSPSMDISKASNFRAFRVRPARPRWRAHRRTCSGRRLAKQGGFTLTPASSQRLAGFGFVSGKSTHADRLATIRDTWQQRYGRTDRHAHR